MNIPQYAMWGLIIIYIIIRMQVMISANQPVPVNNSIQYENTNQRTDDIQNDVRP